ncbi:hypothetical protein OG470_08120 [Micromonospora sp. NBC_00389]|uniref:hypothetical protein n=1 Tax=Micromonospora sp. NBC_00389 TaxID=2903586 RepID=UPI002E1A437B
MEAEASAIGWIAAALPALGFLTMVKIALGRADPAPPERTARPTRVAPGPPLIVEAGVPDTREPVPAPPLPVPANTAPVRDFTTAVPAPADQDPAVPDRRAHDPTVRDRGPEIAALVPAARTAARTLTAEGTPLSRKALAQQLRADGRQLSNATASTLVRVLRAETTPPAPDLSHREAA